ncbi:MFS transporter [Nocardia lijiangensis]|uniref:MFS transporter n=1 Tax=Nocardia lijiangensis TaxID=299618 RepID=UPI003D7586BF
MIGAFMFEFIDLYTFAFSAPALIEHLGFTVRDVGTITAAAGIGSFIGAFAGGWAAGRFGRKPALVACLVMFSAPSLVNAVVSTPESFLILRFLTGIGYQGMTVVGAVLLTELVPGRVRGRAIAWVITIAGIGPTLLAWLAFALVPNFEWGWRALYVIGGLGLLLVVPFLRHLPESPRWLESRANLARADSIMTGIEEAVRAAGHTITPLPASMPAQSATAKPAHDRGSGIRALFREGFGKRFVVTCALWIFGVVAYFGFTSWLSTLLKLQGYDLGQSTLITAVITTVGLLGFFASTVVTDRWQRKYSLAVVGTVLGIVALLFTAGNSTAYVLAIGCLLQVLFQVVAPITQTYSAEVFPTRFRSIGSGWASASARIGNILGALAITAILDHWGIPAVFYFIAALMFILAIVMASLGESTSGSLERSDELADPESAVPAGGK